MRYKMNDEAIKFTEATTLAKASGLRSGRERLTLALLNGELAGERNGNSWWVVRSSFEVWLEGELDLDRLENSNSLRLAEARSLARLEGIENASDRVLQAVMCGEIEQCQRDGANWLIPRGGFEQWMEDVATVEEPEEVEPSVNIEELYNLEPTAYERFDGAVTVWAPVVGAVACCVGLVLVIFYLS